MKVSMLGALSVLGMAGAFGAVYGVTPKGGFGVTREEVAAGVEPSSSTGAAEESPVIGATFERGTTVEVGARLGHASFPKAGGESFVMLEVRGDSDARSEPAPVALSLVIDRSGSMKGARLANALRAAATAVERLRDGDSVSVVAFDTRTEVFVPLMNINAATRANILSAIRAIPLGGDTCISCGIEASLLEFKSVPAGSAKRMLVLSDGDANNGIRDVPGFRSLAERAMSQGVNISTIGVDLDFNEKIMSAIAQGANGRNYFVEREGDLDRVFDAEAATLTQSVATDVKAEITLSPGVELVSVFDRTFSRRGGTVEVPLGTLARGEVKTVLVKVRLSPSETEASSVAAIRVAFHDIGERRDATVSGDLATRRGPESSPGELDGIVLDRVERSETASALKEANNLFSLGKTDEARRRLERRQSELGASRKKAEAAAPAGRAADVDKSFEQQAKGVEGSLENFQDDIGGGDQPRPAPPASKAQIKRNASSAHELGL